MSAGSRPSSLILLLLGELLTVTAACSSGDEQRSEEPPLPSWAAEGALPVPDPEDGFQIHFGPADLDDPDAVFPFVLEPGGEEVVCGYARAPNEDDAFYRSYEIVQREGAHHLLVGSATPDAPLGSARTCAFEDPATFFLNVQGGLVPGGSRFTYPDPEAVAPENVGLAYPMPALQRLALQGHFVNATDAPLLEEVWVNFRFLPPEEVRVLAGPFTFYVGTAMQIPPHTRQVVRGACAPPPETDEVRLLDLFGHVHAHGKRVSAWHVTPDPAGGEPLRTLVYETYDWQELEQYSYDSVTKNPPVLYGSGRGGAWSGILRIARNDSIEVECEFDNTTDRTLSFIARAFEGEMCAAIGSYAPSTGQRWYCATE